MIFIIINGRMYDNDDKNMNISKYTKKTHNLAMIWGSLRSNFYCTKVLFEKREYRFKCIVVEWLVYLTFPFKHIFLFKCTFLYCHLINCSPLLQMLCNVTKHLFYNTHFKSFAQFIITFNIIIVVPFEGVYRLI